jgi:hypothetical protein
MMTARSTSLIKLSPSKTFGISQLRPCRTPGSADGGDARGLASRLSSEGLVHQLRQFGLAFPDVEVMFAAAHESGSVQLAQSGQSGMSAHRSRSGVKRARNARYELFSP